MILVKEQTGIQIIELAKQYGDFLIEKKIGTHDLRHRKIHDASKQNSLNWNNPENLDTGMSGVLLFLLELYRQTHEEYSLKAIDQSIGGLVEYCNKTPTNNYAFYTGRSGVIYLLIQRFLLQRDDKLIRMCLDLVRPANLSFLHSTDTTDYLYDGRAGTLLLLLHLYRISNEGFLLRYIDEFLEIIVQNARLSPDGVFWNNEAEHYIRPSCGFAHGTAGIRYVLDQLNQYARNSALDFLISESDKYIQSCWMERLGNWGNFRADILCQQTLEEYRMRYSANDSSLFEPKDEYSWANGAIGIFFSLQQTIKGNENETIKDKIETIDTSLFFSSPGLYDGMASLGMFYLSVDRERYKHGLRKIISTFLEPRFTSPEKMDAEGGLLHSRMGLYYCLLKAGEEGAMKENILMPFQNHENDDDSIWDLSVNLSMVKKSLLTDLYPRTLFLLEEAFSQPFTEYLNTSAQPGSANEIALFSVFVENKLKAKIPPASYERIIDVFTLEKEKLAFLHAEKRSPLQVYLDDLNFQDTISEFLNKPDVLLLKQSLCISKNIKIIKSKWDWSFFEDLKEVDKERIRKKYRQNMQDASEEFLYFLQIFGKLEITEVPFTTITLMLKAQFETSKTIQDAIYGIGLALKKLPESSVRTWLLPELNHKKLNSADDLLKELDWLILKYLKPLIYRNVLVLSPAPV